MLSALWGRPTYLLFAGRLSVTRTKNARGGAAHRVTLTVVASVSLQPARQRNHNIMLVLDDAAGLGTGLMVHSFSVRLSR